MNLKVLRTDRGREYLFEHFKQICDNKGIIWYLMIPYTPTKWGCREEKSNTSRNGQIDDSASKYSNILLGDAILTAAYILNRVPSKSIPSTPYELWYSKKPNLEGLRPWGSAGFVHSTSHKYGKLGPRASKLIFIRYCEHSKGYVMYGEHPDKGMTKIESRNVDFLEVGASIIIEGETPHFYPVIDGDNGSDPKLSRSCSLEEHNSQNPQMRRNKHGGIPRRQYEIEGKYLMCAVVDINEPTTYEEVVTSPNANEWMTAMKEEMSSMAKNNVWELVDLPSGRKTIGNKWVLKVKCKADGSIDKFKARLVAKGNNMEMIVATQKWLSSTFEMMDMGDAEYILGVKIHQDR
ncbi:UNVERIFIED_CONTAM: Copia protein, partial [Sesamum calycinum]